MNNRISMGIRILLMLVGVFILGIGVCILRKVGYGTDPFSCFTIAMSTYFGWNLGSFQAIFNICLLIVVVWGDKHFIGLGTLGNMFGLGYVVQYASPVVANMMPMEMSLLLKIFYTVLGILVLCFGLALYVGVELGASPYDAMGYVIAQKSPISFRLARMGLDIAAATLGFVFGGVVGFVTLIMATSIGPLVQIFRDWMDKCLFYKFMQVPPKDIKPEGLQDSRD